MLRMKKDCNVIVNNHALKEFQGLRFYNKPNYQLSDSG